MQEAGRGDLSIDPLVAGTLKVHIAMTRHVAFSDIGTQTLGAALLEFRFNLVVFLSPCVTSDVRPL